MITSITKKYDLMTNNFSGYKMVKNNITIDVPIEPANTDYQEIQQWIAAGNIVIDNAPSGTEADGGTVIDNGGGE